jgi:hypothetical protein
MSEREWVTKLHENSTLIKLKEEMYRIMEEQWWWGWTYAATPPPYYPHTDVF